MPKHYGMKSADKNTMKKKILLKDKPQMKKVTDKMKKRISKLGAM